MKLMYSADDSIGEVKLAILAVAGIPPERQMLSFGAHTMLQDGLWLNEYNIQAGSTLTLKVLTEGEVDIDKAMLLLK